ncbi:ferrochelatase [Schinkia azotoformans]|uniref:Coproporphyrin III ferrochelatase n=1 Tax=Schinkia azotoformans LMG 9581 TaxID=1131731 RepID=K6CHC0_SCHAZ|nr:ferrochelatase [Schinkia azotoformans]EKN70510.1 ferrochelatase [Schinkia azotoformans LMG 9581]MEC1638988.1 ferrochelatase [Schinkia azotoformans]MEC1947607.1 ferrochelatase [Schinkia azotoformans]MED4354755.1 ferrochelatase [Schinkia azotoformans]
MTTRKIGLLVMAYGTPYKEEDIERYYTHIRRGRKPSPEMLKDLQDRYEAIGGISPLAEITKIQAEALEAKLNDVHDHIEFKMYLGLKHIEPFVEDAVQAMKNDGIEEAVGIVLAPHFSTFSVKSYNARAEEEAEKLGGLKIHFIESWYKEPQFLQFWSENIKAIFSNMVQEEKENAVLIVSAHSLPEKILASGDPYPSQLEETAKLIAEQAGVTNYEIGWQSAGNTPDPWLGPDVQDLTKELYHDKGYRTFVYAPVGFVSDHLEVLYDNDFECKLVTEQLGANYYRPEMPNANPKFIEALSNVVTKKLEEVGE